MGDAHQRIYRNRPILSKCGINVRGRSSILKINYRTTEEIRHSAFHMHPSWQRKIFGALKSTFPNIQFIITTHSPQVISEVDDSYNLFGLKQENDDVTVKPYNVHGWDTNGILHSIMHKAKNENAKQPQCPKEKEDAIVEALRHFQMI